MTLGGLLITRGEPTAEAALDSLRPWTNAILVMVDSRTPEGWEAGLGGVVAVRFTWPDSFSVVQNEGADRLAAMGVDYLFALDSDEVLDGGDRLRSVIAAHPGADAIAVPRRHFLDLAGTREQTTPPWFPDWSWRLRRPHVRLRKRAHPVLAGSPAVAYSTRVVLSHYNLALRSDEDWARVNAFYARLESLEESDQP